MISPSALTMFNTLAHLRKLETQVNQSVARVDIQGASYDDLVKRAEARQIAREAQLRLQKVAGLVQTNLDLRM